MTNVVAIGGAGRHKGLTRRQWAVGLAVLCIVGVWLVLYETGALSETVAAVILVVGVPLLCCALVAYGLGWTNSGPYSFCWRVSAVLLLLAASGLVTIAAVRAVAPGRPLVAWDARTANEVLPLPAEAVGRVRLLATGKLQEGRQAFVTFAISGTETPIEGEIGRSVVHSRSGKRRKQFVQERTAEFQRAFIPDGTAGLQVTRLAGQLDGPLRITVFRDVLPGWLILGVAAASLVALVCVDVYAGAQGRIGSSALTTLAFGVMFAEIANPLRAVRAGLGLVLVASVGGALFGAAMRQVLSRVTESPRNQQQRGSAKGQSGRRSERR